MYVQYGCGFYAPQGWLNFDASPTLRFERIPLLGRLYTRNCQRFPANVRYGDIVKGLPIENASCDGVYASHVLEHLALADCDRALTNTCSYLKPAGIFRLVVPDLEAIVESYLRERRAIQFVESTGMVGTRRSILDWLGNSRHRWLWDEKAMRYRLKHYGFSSIRRAHFGDCEDPRFAEVEERERFEGALAMQAHRLP